MSYALPYWKPWETSYSRFSSDVALKAAVHQGALQQGAYLQKPVQGWGLVKKDLV
jgi:hypothetical protein